MRCLYLFYTLVSEFRVVLKTFDQILLVVSIESEVRCDLLANQRTNILKQL